VSQGDGGYGVRSGSTPLLGTSARVHDGAEAVSAAASARRRVGCATGCLAGDSFIESVEGPVAIATLAGKPMPVLTRLPNGQIGFRLMTKIACTAAGVPVVRVSFDNGQSVVVDHGHVFYAPGMVERAVVSLVAGDVLATSFHFPAGYVYRREDGTAETSVGGVRVVTIEEAGAADVFSGNVNETHCYFVTAGVLCKA